MSTEELLAVQNFSVRNFIYKVEVPTFAVAGAPFPVTLRRLDQNTPNPFNPTTTIRYAIPEEGEVHFTVYNLLGQLVQTLVDQVQSAGYYTVRWDGRTKRGTAAASGIYIYRLDVGTFHANRQMLLLK